MSDRATILDVWKFKQILLRRDIGLRDDAPYEELFNYLLKYGLSRGGRWELYDETYIAGGNHSNSDGSPRWEVLRRCRIGESLRLIREPENPHQGDMRAIKVCRESGAQLGYIPAHNLGNSQGIGPQLANWIDDGTLYRATLTKVVEKCKRGVAEWEMDHGELVDEFVQLCKSHNVHIEPSTVTAQIEIFEFTGPRPESRLPVLKTLKDIAALKRRIQELQKQGIDIGSEASFLDCWKHEQVLSRRSLGLPDDVSRDKVVECVYKQRVSRNGQWKACSRTFYVQPVDNMDETPEAPAFLKMIKHFRVGDRVVLNWEPDDSYFGKTTAFSECGELIGNWGQGLAANEVVDAMASGTPVDAKIVHIHHPFPERIHGFSISVEVRMFVLPDDSALEVTRPWKCAHCGYSIRSPMLKTGGVGACPSCGKTVVISKPEPGRNKGCKTILVKARMVGLKTFRWGCPHCGLMKNTRLSSLGSITKCKGCKLSITLPTTIDLPSILPYLAQFVLPVVISSGDDN